MKLICKIFLIFLVFSCVFAEVIESKSKRGIQNEPILFEVEVDARCEQYLARTLSTIQISKVNNPDCLPIDPNNPRQDINDRHSHVICTNLLNGRSIFRFHEVFVVDEDETPAPGLNYIVSWVVNYPFIEKYRKYDYARRPSCSLKTDKCDPALQIVGGCEDNLVEFNDQGKVVSTDRVYFIPPGQNLGTCKSGGSCCTYINTQATGLCGGIDPCSLCNDNNACTTDTCTGGVCSHSPVSCDDGNSCTTDSCDPITGCKNTPIVCNDNSVCTTDTCVGGSCQFNPISCNDFNLCTVDSCNAITGCQNTPNVCDDNNPCTSDSCNPSDGSCIFTTISCDDNNPCTSDSCDPVSGCKNVNICDDSNACTTDSCDPVSGCSNTPINCDDNSPCTTDSCDPTLGCINTPICNDNNACTTDFCDIVAGCINIPISCDDNNPCTVDTCDPVLGCVHTPVDCSPTNFCDGDLPGTCNPADGTCIFTPRDCNDNNVCTLGDYCDRTLGACSAANYVACGPGSDDCHYKICDPVQQCIELPLSCFDGDSCTKDSCDVNTGTCLNTYFCKSSNPCINGLCTRQDCVVPANSSIPCPTDNGSQLNANYCTYTDLCTGGKTCSSALKCCVNPANPNVCAP